MKQVYMISYPTGKIYVGKDSLGSYCYFDSPNMAVLNADFDQLPEATRRDYTIRKQILWESTDCSEAELSAKEVELIRLHEANNPAIGYNRWPAYRPGLTKSENDTDVQHAKDGPWPTAAK